MTHPDELLGGRLCGAAIDEGCGVRCHELLRANHGRTLWRCRAGHEWNALGQRISPESPVAPEQLHFPDLDRTGTQPLESIQERFASFHAKNPHVYEYLRREALHLVHRGFKRVSVGMLFEVMRYSAMRTRGDDIYKLNNDYRSRYARLLIDNEPELVDAIETRKLTA